MGRAGLRNGYPIRPRHNEQGIEKAVVDGRRNAREFVEHRADPHRELEHNFLRAISPQQSDCLPSSKVEQSEFGRALPNEPAIGFPPVAIGVIVITWR